MKTGPTQKPNPHPFYGDNYHRGLDPWHRDAFPDEFKDSALRSGQRLEGWFLEDAYGNQIDFIPDGIELP
jgi:hypothetical protein